MADQFLVAACSGWQTSPCAEYCFQQGKKDNRSGSQRAVVK
ncbi:hypothetical protein [Gimesia sp.]|nr:hypothetical protein [Gimesia sp.]